MLEIKNLQISVDNKKIIDNLNLNINDGEIHVLIGKNGVGKSSIAKMIVGDDSYKVNGTLKYNENDLTKLNISERAKLGIYLVNQMPPQIEGVTNAEMLRIISSEKKDAPLNILEFNKNLENICEELELDKSFIHREINVGCSGGERKKIELMHMWVIKPSFIILDEIDSGLDVDAINIVSKNIKKYYDINKPAILIITHSEKLINTFDNYFVHVIDNNKQIDGDENLAKKILNSGFRDNLKTNVISEFDQYE